SGAPAMKLSLEANRAVATEGVTTICDGVAVRVPVAEALIDLQGAYDEILLVDDNAAIEASRTIFAEHGIVVEPSGALGLAALLANRAKFKGARASVILAGGNLTQEQIKEWLV